MSFCSQDYVDAPLSIPDFLTHTLNIDWSQYQVRADQADRIRVKGWVARGPWSLSCLTFMQTLVL
jgi:hypothetical protein